MMFNRETQRAQRYHIQKLPWSMRIKEWWNAPRAIGLLAIILGLAHYLPIPRLPVQWLIDLHSDLAPELIGIGLTVIVIDWAVERRQEQQLLSELRTKMRSKSRDVSESAIVILRQRKWLYDGSLINTELSEANLYESELSKAVLIGASLYRANFQNAILSGADLRQIRAWWVSFIGANLRMATLREASLNGAFLQNANFIGADLTGAQLSDADLTKANLEGAILERVDLSGAKMCNAFLRNTNLHEADLSNANLESANCPGAILNNANLSGANLHGADFLNANLSGAKVTLHQLSKLFTVEGATMPNGVRLGRQNDGVVGPTFTEWKAKYLATHGGTETDLRDPL